MVTAHTRPAFLYGKTTAKSRVPQDYRVLAENSRFTAADVRTLQRIPGGFSWNASRQGMHAPCFAYVRLERSAAVLRLLDVGFDDQGRPHCLRMEAARLDETADANDDRTLASLLTAAAWPETPVEIGAEPVVEFRPAEPDGAVLELLAARRRDGREGSLLVGDATSFANSTFETVLDSATGHSLKGNARTEPAAGTRQAARSTAAAPAGAPSTSSVVRAPAATSSRHGGGFLSGLFWGVVVCGVVGGAAAAWYVNERAAEAERVRAEQEAERATLKKQLQNALSEKAALDDVVATARSKSTSQEQTIAAWKHAAEAIGVATPAELERQIKTLRADPNEFLRRENEKLRQENSGAKKKLDAVRRAIEDEPVGRN